MSETRTIKIGEKLTDRKKLYFRPKLISSPNSPALNEAGGQPQISINGGALTSVGVGPLVHVGNGLYYSVLSDSVIEEFAVVAGDVIKSRYSSDTALETEGSTLLVTDHDTYRCESDLVSVLGSQERASLLDLALGRLNGLGQLQGASFADSAIDLLLNRTVLTNTLAGSVGEALQPLYHMSLAFNYDPVAGADRYTVQWFRNNTPLTAGVDTCSIRVYNRSDGLVLFGPTSMTQIGSTSMYKYDTVDVQEKLKVGETYIVEIVASIDGTDRINRSLVTKVAG